MQTIKKEITSNLGRGINFGEYYNENVVGAYASSVKDIEMYRVCLCASDRNYPPTVP